MRMVKGFVAMVFAVACVTAATVSTAAQSKAPEASAEWKAYVTYVNTLAGATKLEDVFQSMNTPLVDFFKNFKNADRPKVLQALKDAMTANGAFSGTMRLVREESEPTAKYLVLEATTPENKKVTGKVKMVKEGAWIKLASVPDDEDWHEVKK